MSRGPICSDSRWGTELYVVDVQHYVTLRTRSERESGTRGWVQVTDVPGFLGVALVLQCLSPGQVVVALYVRNVSFISMNWGSVEKDKRLIPANHSTTSS